MAKKESNVKYLAKIEFDCNDADYVYGCKVISKKQRDVLEANDDYTVNFGSCDFGDNESTISECISIKKITEEEYLILKKLGLDDFGEGYRLESIIEDLEDDITNDEDDD